MLLTNAPSKILLPFANSGTKNTIPIPSQIGITDGAASYTDGFPPKTMLPVSSGGVPPYGADFNGILNSITAVLRWMCGGGLFEYDGTWSSDNTGYPKNAILQKASGQGFWICTADNNTTDPDGGSPANWVDLGQVLTAVVTPSQFDNSTKPASTAFVQKLLGNLTGVSAYTASVALSGSQAGQAINFYGSTSGQTISLPISTTVPVGGGFWITNQASVAFSLAPQAENLFANTLSGSSIVSSITMSPGDSVFAYVSSGGSWSTFGKSTTNAFPSTKGAYWQTELPNGFIWQGGMTGSISGNSSFTLNFPNAFPSAAVGIQITKENSDVTNEQTFDASSPSRLGVVITNTSAAAGACWWQAIGY